MMSVFGGFLMIYIYVYVNLSPFNVYGSRVNQGSPTIQSTISILTCLVDELNDYKESTLWINIIQRGRFYFEICWISTGFYHVLSSQNIRLRLDGDTFSQQVVLFCVGMLNF